MLVLAKNNPNPVAPPSRSELFNTLRELRGAKKHKRRQRVATADYFDALNRVMAAEIEADKMITRFEIAYL